MKNEAKIIERQKQIKFGRRWNFINSKNCHNAKRLRAHIAISRMISDLNSFNGGYKRMQTVARMETDLELLKQFTILINE